MILSLLLACPNTSTDKSDTAGGDDAWPEWEEEATADDDGTAGEDSALPEEIEWVEECEPDGCIELAEAVDRGFASVRYGMAGLRVSNTGADYDVCFDRWYTFLSTTSQDAVAGTTSAGLVLEPGDTLDIPYATWGSDVESWWCVEHNQYTSSGSDYTFNGSRAPTRVATYTNDSCDDDRDGHEDHSDTSSIDGLPETQHSVWDYIDDEPVFIVGRRMNWFEVGVGQTVRVALEVTNLGRRRGEATVSEQVPAGWEVSTVSPAADSHVTDSAGNTVLTWSVALGAAVEPSDPYSPTNYDEVELEYALTYTGDCAGREIGYAPNVRWAGTSGSFISEGSSLVVECCGGEEGGLGGGGGLGGLP